MANSEHRLVFIRMIRPPIPRPSRYYGRRQYASLGDQLRKQNASLAPPLRRENLIRARSGSTRANSPLPSQTTTRQGAPQVGCVPAMPRLRTTTDRSPPSPVCTTAGNWTKVSDEFTVPLCRGHHRQLHQAGNEAAWWVNLNINALEIAKRLWEESRGDRSPAEPQAVRKQVLPDLPRQNASKLPNEP